MADALLARERERQQRERRSYEKARLIDPPNILEALEDPPASANLPADERAWRRYAALRGYRLVEPFRIEAFVCDVPVVVKIEWMDDNTRCTRALAIAQDRRATGALDPLGQEALARLAHLRPELSFDVDVADVLCRGVILDPELLDAALAVVASACTSHLRHPHASIYR